MNAHQAYQCRRTADTDTAAGSATLIYAASIMKGPPARVAVAVREVMGGGTTRVADAAGNCRFCKLSSIKLSENKLHNIMAKWTIKARDALLGQFVLRVVARGGARHMLHNPHRHEARLASSGKRAKLRAVINHQLRLSPSGIMR